MDSWRLTFVPVVLAQVCTVIFVQYPRVFGNEDVSNTEAWTACIIDRCEPRDERVVRFRIDLRPGPSSLHACTITFASWSFRQGSPYAAHQVSPIGGTLTWGRHRDICGIASEIREL